MTDSRRGRTVTILGSTGSIGLSTLDVLRRYQNHHQIYALVAGRKATLLVEQILEFRPQVVCVADSFVQDELASLLAASGLPKSHWPELAWGPDSYCQAATAAPVDFVMSSIVGVAGLEATYAAVCQGKRVGLANKETLVAGGRLIMEACAAHGAELIPVDSEHNGAHQCLRAGRRDEVTRLILTASGGPFRLWPKQQLAHVTPQQALAHPTWKMGPRITIDSATLMNKGFEVIEACWLFGFTPQEVEVVIHPQSTVHAMVEYKDGSVVAQISATDMRMPIQYALTWPLRDTAPVPKLDWNQRRQWEFDPPDLDKFPLLRTAYAAIERGGSAGCTLNAADEVAVQHFLEGKIGFLDIAPLVEETLERMPWCEPRSIQEILEIDQASRKLAATLAAQWATARR